MAGSHDPGRPVHVDSDVVRRRKQWLARVQTHPYADRAIGERPLGLDCRRNSIRGALKSDEERIAFAADLVSTMARKRGPQHSPMLLEGTCISLAAKLPQPLDDVMCRAHVGLDRRACVRPGAADVRRACQVVDELGRQVDER